MPEIFYFFFYYHFLPLLNHPHQYASMLLFLPFKKIISLIPQPPSATAPYLCASFFCKTYLKNSLLNVSKSLSSLSHSGFDSYSNFLEMIPLTSVLLNQWSVLNPHLLDPTALFNQSLLLKILFSPFFVKFIFHS